MAMRLGQEVPNFPCVSTKGEFSFHEFCDSRPELPFTIMFTHPKDFTPVCTTELGMCHMLVPQFEALGCKLIGVSCDSVEDHQAWSKDVLARASAVTLKNVLKACETETVRRKKLEAQVAELERLVREGALNRRRSTVHEGEEPPAEEPPLESPAAKLMWKKANRHAFAAARAKAFLEELQRKRAEAEALKAEESEEEPPPAVDYFAQPAKEESESSDEAPVYQSSGKKPAATWTKERHGRMKEKGKEITQDDLQTPR